MLCLCAKRLRSSAFGRSLAIEAQSLRLRVELSLVDRTRESSAVSAIVVVVLAVAVASVSQIQLSAPEGIFGVGGGTHFGRALVAGNVDDADEPSKLSGPIMIKATTSANNNRNNNNISAAAAAANTLAAYCNIRPTKAHLVAR